MLKLRLGRNSNAMGAKFKCEVQCNSARAVKEQWKSILYCYRVGKLCEKYIVMYSSGECSIFARVEIPMGELSTNSLGFISPLLRLAASVTLPIFLLQPLQPFQSSSSRSFLCILMSRLPCYVFCICVLTYEYRKCNWVELINYPPHLQHIYTGHKKTRL